MNIMQSYASNHPEGEIMCRHSFTNTDLSVVDIISWGYDRDETPYLKIFGKNIEDLLFEILLKEKEITYKDKTYKIIEQKPVSTLKNKDEQILL